MLCHLKCTGLLYVIVKLIGTYLRNRRQFVQISNELYGLLLVNSDLLQGSALGPLLFLIYINDLADVIYGGASIRLFADDCVIFQDISAVNDHMILHQM